MQVIRAIDCDNQWLAFKEIEKMLYKIEFKPQSLKDGKKIPKRELERIFEKIEALKENMFGDVKHLTNTEPEYRLRVGDYRVLFEVEGELIVVYRIRHRKDIYR